MPKKITNCTVVVHRDIKDEGTGETRTVRVRPPIGKAFNYTDKEVAEVLAANPRGLRDPINEDVDASREEVVASAVTADPAAAVANAKADAAKKGNARASKATPDAPAGAVIVDKTDTKTDSKVDSDI